VVPLSRKEKQMPNYRVWCTWVTGGYYYVNAASETEAMDIAADEPNYPEEQESISGSFDVEWAEEVK